MIVFHEGLPGSGKSYEAVLSFIVPALRDGKHVYTNIRGVDSDAVARYLGIAPVFLRDRLHLTSPDPTPEESQQSETAHLDRQKAFFLQAGTDCLIVWDEIQDFFPTSRQPVTPAWSEFVAAHRHLARHIVLMGQDIRDVHAIWRRRTEQLIRFRKLTMIGQGGRYRWDIYQNKGGDKWVQVDGGIRKYDPAIFALYQSIRGDQNNHALLKHEKANPLARSWGLRFGVPAFLVVLVWAFSTIAGIFGGEGFGTGEAATEAQPADVPADPVPSESVQPPAKRQDNNAPTTSEPAPARTDYLARLMTDYQPWLTGLVESREDGTKWRAQVTFFAKSGGQPVIELDRRQLEAMASTVERHPVGLRLVTLDGSEHFLTYRAAPERNYTTSGAVNWYQRTASATAHAERSEP